MMTTQRKNIPTLGRKPWHHSCFGRASPAQTHPTAKNLMFWSHLQWFLVPQDGYFKMPALHLYSLNSAEIHTVTHRNRLGHSFGMDQYLHQHWYLGTLPLRKDAFHFMSPQERWGSLGFYSCQRQTSLFWRSTEICREKGNKETGCEQDQINTYWEVCIAFV